MKSTLIVCSHNRALMPDTQLAIIALCTAGAAYVDQSGTTDVSLARNLALTAACAQAEAKGCDVVLMVDDDMVFDLGDARWLVDHARLEQVAASAMYATSTGSLAACRLQTPEGQHQRWATGLGLLAIPIALLEELERSSERFDFMGQPQVGFTWSAAEGGMYWSEDFTLCRRLGGVHLLPIPVGHLKTIPLYPDEETVEAIRSGTPLTGTPDLGLLKRITLTGPTSSGLPGLQPREVAHAAD